MKILMFGMSSYPGGIENYIANYFLSDEFASKMTIDFVTYEGRLAYEDKIKQCGYNVKCVPHLKKHPFGYIKAVKKLLKEGKYDCVYVNMLSAANAVPLKYASKFKVPKIVAHAHLSSTVKGWLRKFLHRKNKKYCDKCANVKLACSQNAGKWIFNGEFSVVPNAIDINRFACCEESRKQIRKKYNISENTLLLGHVGRIAVQKNHDFLIDVFNSLNQISDRPVRLMMVGDGDCKDLIEQKVERLGLKEKAIFVGTSNETEKYYSAFDCFVFPSIFEGLPLSVLEAQVSGLRCFCSDCLTKELDVTKTIIYLPLKNGAEFWARKILEFTKEELNRKKLNDLMQKSEFCLNSQLDNLMNLLNC